jgi:hypothetical protein
VTLDAGPFPTITVTPSGVDSNGDVTFTGSFDFPNTYSSGERYWEIWRGERTICNSNYGPVPESGTFPLV